MTIALHHITADHRELVRLAAEAAGISDPVAIQLDEFQTTVLNNSKRVGLVPIEGMLVRDWDRTFPKYFPGIRFGIRLYSFEGIRLARSVAEYSQDLYNFAHDFFIVARADYLSLFRKALRLRRQSAPTALPPILPDSQFETLHRNTLGYLKRDNLTRIRELGGRPRRGLLLSGPPGNGKTSACRWLWEECHRLRFEYRIVTPDAYQEARRSCNPVEAVKALFMVSKSGIVFFDDMDIALRDRALSPERDDQNVFLGAMDGIEAKEGVVYVFTTNCPIDLIDPAFKRPGRIDLVLQFDVPDAELRRRLLDRWHPEIQAGVDLECAVEDTRGWSYAEIEELRNLLILGHMDSGSFDWHAAMRQWEINRQDLSAERKRAIGFNLNGQLTH